MLCEMHPRQVLQDGAAKGAGQAGDQVLHVLQIACQQEHVIMCWLWQQFVTDVLREHAPLRKLQLRQHTSNTSANKCSLAQRQPP
jgi:hypothetical protein